MAGSPRPCSGFLPLGYKLTSRFFLFLFSLVMTAPAEHRIAHHIVEDLIARWSVDPRGRGYRAQDALRPRAQRFQEFLHGIDRPIGPFSEILCRQRDLRSRSCDQMLKHRGGDIELSG